MTIKVRVPSQQSGNSLTSAPFPAQVQGGNGVNVTKSNGTWTIEIDSASLSGIIQNIIASLSLVSFPGFDNPSVKVGLTAKNGSGAKAMRYDAAPALDQAISPTMTGNWTYNPTSGTAISINPATGTLAKGFDVSQSGGVVSTSGADQNYNSILIINDRATVGAARANGLHVQQITINGALGQRAAITGLSELAGTGTATGGDIIGVSGLGYAIAPNGGTNTGAGAAGTIYGTELSAQAASGAINYLVVSGGEVDAIINTGGSAAHRWGLSFSANGDLRGAQTDAAIEIHDATVAGRYANFMLFRGTPLIAGGSIFGTDGTVNTFTNAFDFTNITFTGNIITSTNINISGAGDVAAKSLSANGGDVAFLTFKKAAVDFNAANTDNAIAITLPTGYTRYVVNGCRISNASHSLTTATVGLFTAAAAGGFGVVASGSAVTVSATTDATNNNMQALTIVNPSTQSYTQVSQPNLYFRTQTAEGAAAIADVSITVIALP